LKLIFIYGPPAVGKLTVATELAKLTGFKLFHNHVSIQFVQSIFEFGTKTFWRLTDKFRLEILEEASKEDVDTVFTFVYGKAADDAFVRNVIHRVKLHGGRVCFVRLYCDEQTLAKRVKAKDRRRMGKISTKSKLHGVLKKYDLASQVPFQSSVSFDTTDKSPKRVAELVARHYKLHTSKQALSY
jgi:broad-specificity NMP kinase